MAENMAEIVYGTREEGHVMSDKVSQLASSVYSEFEKMIKKYDEDVVKELMPLVVGILESLDQAYSDKSEVDVEMELLREDNEQLLTQYEREKQLRKSADQKYLENEDEREEYQKYSEEKIESLESQLRMLELKNKNASDHLNRMENKEADLQKEYSKVHERYTELMRTHMDYMERAKMLMGSDRIAEMANSPRSRGGFQLPNLKAVGSVHLTGSLLGSTNSPPDASAFDMMSPRSGKDSNTSIKSELSELEMPDINSNTGRNVHVSTETSDKEQNTDQVSVREFATGTKKTDDEKKDVPSPAESSENKKPDSESNETKSSPSDNGADTVDAKTAEAEVKKDVSQVNDNSDNSQTDASKESEVKEVTDERTQVENVPKVSESETSEKEASEAKSVEPPVELTKEVDEKAVINKDSVQKLPAEKTVEKSEKPLEASGEVKHKKSKPKNIEVSKDRANFSKSESEHIGSPLSPVFDANDFTFEEDAMPGLDDTIAHIVATTPELDDMEESMESSASMNNNTTNKRNNTSIYDELTIQDADMIGDVDYGADITGRSVNPADYASSDSEDEKEERNSNVSDNFFGMSRELENLILENTELLATKNALNIVKDDLIAKVDELSSEQEILKEEIHSLKGGKDKLQGRIKELEEELKKTKDEMEKKAQQAQEGENEDDVPMAQRKRFTRVEMARVLMERNQYKERLMELQEAVRWTEMIRASREHPEISQAKKKSSIWNFFGNLVAPDPPPAPTTKKKKPYETQIV